MNVALLVSSSTVTVAGTVSVGCVGDGGDLDVDRVGPGRFVTVFGLPSGRGHGQREILVAVGRRCHRQRDKSQLEISTVVNPGAATKLFGPSVSVAPDRNVADFQLQRLAAVDIGDGRTDGKHGAVACLRRR